MPDRNNSYTILSSDNQTPGIEDWRDTTYLREKYLSSTEDVISKMDGSDKLVEFVDAAGNKSSGKPADAAIYLDKSARPVKWFVEKFWEALSEGGAAMPESHCLNIDRKYWFMSQGHTEGESEHLTPDYFHIDEVPQDVINSIRAIFVVGNLPEENWMGEVENLPTILDGKNVMIVDEVSNTGSTLIIAQQLLRRTIPEARFGGTTFWTTSHSPQGMGSVPAWYDGDSSFGRGVGEVDDVWYKRSFKLAKERLQSTKDTNEDEYAKLYEEYQKARKRSLGSLALSAPHYDKTTYEILPDIKAEKLKEDIDLLYRDFLAGKIMRSGLGMARHLTRPDGYKINSWLEENGLTMGDVSRWINRKNR